MEDFDVSAYLAEKMRERINLGGFLLTRAEAYRALIEDGQSVKAASYFAFSGSALTDEEAEGWPDVLTGYENLSAANLLDELGLEEPPC